MTTETTETTEATEATTSIFNGKEVVTQDDVIMFIDADCVSDLIKPNPSNRVDKTHVHHIKRLKKSLTKQGFSKHNPIIVGSDGVIKAGHHRYYASLELGIGIWIRTDDKYDLKTISQMENIAKKWTSMDWIRKFANEGIGDYPEILKFCETYQFGVKVNLMLLTGKTNESHQDTFDKITNGEFKVENWTEAHYKASCIKSFGQYLNKEADCNNTYFAASVLHCLSVNGYSHEEMIRKTQVQSRKLRLQRNRRDNVEMLQDIYNFKRHTSKKLHFVTLK